MNLTETHYEVTVRLLEKGVKIGSETFRSIDDCYAGCHDQIREYTKKNNVQALIVHFTETTRRIDA